MNIYLNCIYTGAGARAMVEELRSSGVQEAVWKEDGCLQYDYFLSAQREDQVVLLEKWRDEEALAVHMKAPNMDRIVAIKDKHGVETEVRRLTLLEK